MEQSIREPGIRENSYRGIAASAQAQRALGRAVAEATSQIDLPITGMTCASCVTRIEKALGGEPYTVVDWRELNNNLFTALTIQKAALLIFLTLIIVGLGLEELSMNAVAIPVVKSVLRASTLDEARQLADQATRLPTPDDIEDLIREHMTKRFPDSTWK